MADMDNNKTIGIIGSGLIGRSWAMLFVGAGFQVKLYDTVGDQVCGALEDIDSQLTMLQRRGLLRGRLTSAQQFSRISVASSLKDCVTGVRHVQECIPENLELKRDLFRQLDHLATEDVVLSSSTSCIAPSQFTETLATRGRCIVAHPVNPPYYVPLVELVPAPWTEPGVLARTRELMETIGQAPVTLNRELPGFALNRIQYAILNECWRLVSDGVLSASDVDTVMKCGLGPRYAFMGPLETAHLNAEGLLSYCERYGATIHAVSSTFGPAPRMEGAQAQQIHAQLAQQVPPQQLQERRAWRDARLAALAKLKNEMDTKQ